MNVKTETCVGAKKKVACCKIPYEDTGQIAPSVGSSLTQQPVTELNREVTNNARRTEAHCVAVPVESGAILWRTESPLWRSAEGIFLGCSI